MVVHHRKRVVISFTTTNEAGIFFRLFGEECQVVWTVSSADETKGQG